MRLHAAGCWLEVAFATTRWLMAQLTPHATPHLIRLC